MLFHGSGIISQQHCHAIDRDDLKGQQFDPGAVDAVRRLRAAGHRIERPQAVR